MAKKKKRRPCQLPSGHFRKQITLGYDKKTGRRITKSITAKTETEAIIMAADYKRRHGIGCPLKNITVFAAISRYIESREDIIATSTLRGYRRMQHNSLQSIMDIELDELCLYDVQKAASLDVKNKNHSRATIKHALGLLNSSLLLMDIDMHLLKRVTIPAPKAEKPELPRVSDVIAAIKDTEFEIPALLAIWCSLRVSEVRGLQYCDISKDGKHITVRRTRIYMDGQDYVSDRTKTVRSNRTIRLPKYLLELIMAQPHKSDDDFIVDKTYNQVSQNFRRYMKNKGLKMTFHQLRHLFASTANDLGVADVYIQKMGGWASNNILKTIYTHTSHEKEDEFQNIIDGFFLGLINDANGAETHF